MSDKQFSKFEKFIVSELINWAPSNIKQGFRYQFKSPDNKNRESLFSALLDISNDKTVKFETQTKDVVELPFIEVDELKLIPLLQSDSEKGFTQDFISFLRDEIGRTDSSLYSFSLLIIHNSKLDTIENSSLNLDDSECVWSHESIKNALDSLIDLKDQGKEISKVLLDYQCDTIINGKGTLFGFKELYSAIDDGDLKFDELFLLDDPHIHDYESNPKQQRKRLDQNRELYESIEYEINENPGILEERLSNKFSSKFIKAKFPKGNQDIWKNYPITDYWDEIKRNQKQTLELDKIVCNSSTFEDKTKGSSKAQQREWHILLEAPTDLDCVEVEMLWNGGDLENSHLTTPNRLLPDGSEFKVVSKGSKKSKTKLSVPFDGKPIFFTVGTGNREKGSDKYTLHFLILREGQFNTKAIQNTFLLHPKKKLVRLLTNECVLAVNPAAYTTVELNELNQQIKWNDVKSIDFKSLSDRSNDIEFSIVNGENRLDFHVEGETADSKLSLPLIFDSERANSILNDQYFGQFNRDKDKVIIDNKEVQLVSNRRNLMRLEAIFIDEMVVGIDEVTGKKIELDELETVDDDLYQSYCLLFEYCKARNSVPSIISWGQEFREIVSKLINSYILLLEQAEIDKVVSKKLKLALSIGLVKKEDSELISPFHPIVLSYYLSLTEQFENDLIASKSNRSEASFKFLPKVTVDRLNPRGLIPYLFDKNDQFSHVNVCKENSFWLEAIPHEQSQYDFVTKLVKEKIIEFQTAFPDLFKSNEQCKLVLNSVNQGSCHELFLGIVSYYKENLDKSSFVHVNVYDNDLLLNSFDQFAEANNSEELKVFLELTAKKYKDNADSIIELLRTRLTYSKFKTSDVIQYEYAHISFFYNDEKVDCIRVNMDSKPSGIAADGLIGGEASESQSGSYHTAFGLSNIDYKSNLHLHTAMLFGSLIRPAREENTPYSGKDALALAVNENFKNLLNQTCDSSIWTTVIDPKVTLEFFGTQDKVLIHYSDQYTSSAGFDAITVSRQKDLFTRVLELGEGTKISDFNSFNGDWLLKMLTSSDTSKLGMEGEIGAYKLVTALLNTPDTVWLPLSVGEMVRVSGNIGLKILDSDLSAANAGHKGKMSDDVLMVGIKGQTICILPVEVKTGSTPDYKAAKEQVTNLRNHLKKQLGPRNLKGKLNRALFFRQLLVQIEKYKLYSVFPDSYFSEILAAKTEWLRGEYHVEDDDRFPIGIIVSHLNSDCIFEPDANEENDIVKIDLPIALLPTLVQGDLKEFLVGEGLPAKFNFPYFSNLIANKASTTDLTTVAMEPKIIANKAVEAVEAVELEVMSVNSESSGTTTGSEGLKVLIGHDVLTERELHWEPTNTAKFMNTNSGIIGTMGTGKTQCTKSVVTQLYRDQHKNVDGSPIGILIFDYKSDYVDDKFMSATNAQKFDLDCLPYNPLSLFGDKAKLPVHTASAFANTMTQAFGLGPKQQMRLKNLVLDAYELKGIDRSNKNTWSIPAPTLSDVWDVYMDQEKVEQDSLYAALDSLVSFEIFEPDASKVKSLYDLVEGVTVIELAGYDSSIQNLIVALTLDLFYAQMQKSGKPEVQGDFRQVTKLVLVDEADNFMSQNFPSLRKILKEGREYGVGVILSTQDITHFKTSENDYSTYVLSWIVHRVSQIKNQDIKSIFNKDDKHEQDNLMKSIRELEKHYSLYVDGDKKITKIKDKAFWELLQ
ncbi:DNA phosphorothioation-dependent restriction protein DptH [Vibrio kyushuensis]|uniref:DNA phosphorothioation-dependent restriction protein DptH n=1 Tax=Vibrio kyushuensis TaxID=2910249 RepID=UPI003D12035E